MSFKIRNITSSIRVARGDQPMWIALSIVGSMFACGLLYVALSGQSSTLGASRPSAALITVPAK
jgi:hypothetical protein